MGDENLFTMDDFNDGVESEIQTTETTETTAEVKAESTTEAKTEGEPVEAGAPEEKEEKGDDSGAESPTEEYVPNLSYKVKDKEHEFPEWLKGVVTDADKEGQLRDLFTKVDGIDAIKESRDRVETDYNNYQQSVQNDIFPVLDNIKSFDQANAVKDFGKAWEISDVNPEDIMDYMLMDDGLSQTLAAKYLEQIKLEEAGPQAVQQQKTAWNESARSRELELQNKSMEMRLAQMEENTFSQALDFSLSQNQDAVNLFDRSNGEGAFKKFVGDYRSMKAQQGVKLSPSEVIGESMAMLGLSSTATKGTVENNNEQLPTVTPQESKQPAAIPNVGTGANVSMVQKTATSWEDWEKSMGQI